MLNNKPSNMQEAISAKLNGLSLRNIKDIPLTNQSKAPNLVLIKLEETASTILSSTWAEIFTFLNTQSSYLKNIALIDISDETQLKQLDVCQYYQSHVYPLRNHAKDDLLAEIF